MHIHPRRRHDHISLAPQKPQLAAAPPVLQDRRSPATRPYAVACLRPAMLPSKPSLRAPAPRRLRNLHLAPWQRFAQRPMPNLERMIQRHQRRRLRHPIALNHRNPHRSPERLQLTRQRRSPADQRPEPPPQPAMHPPQPPPPLPNRQPRHPLPPPSPATHLHSADAHAATPSHAAPQSALRSARASATPPSATAQAAPRSAPPPQHRRNPQPHELPKHMAQRKRMHKPQRMNHPLVPPVLRNLALNRLQTHQHIAMRMHNPLRLRGRA